MPRLPINYENALIYKLVCNDINITEIYVGSTTNFTVRKDSHKTKCSNELSKSYNFKVYQYIRANGVWSNWSMIEIEKFPCTDSLEARKRERYWIETLKATLNCNIPSRTKSERYLDNKEQIAEQSKIYREANKEQLAEQKKIYNDTNKEQIAEQKKIHYLANREKTLEQKKIYNEANKEQITEYRKINYLANREKILDQKKIYNEANKEQIAEKKKIRYLANKEQRKEHCHVKFDCPCGGKYCHGDKSRHLKCQKHLAYLENTQSPPLAI
jgi:hypothetical protein